jgi:hypothetical protein
VLICNSYEGQFSNLTHLGIERQSLSHIRKEIFKSTTSGQALEVCFRKHIFILRQGSGN